MIRTKFNVNEKLNKKETIQDDISIIKKVLEIVSNIVIDNNNYKLDEKLHIQITSKDEVIHNILFNKYIKIYDEVIQYKNSTILLSKIVKFKIIIDNEIDNKIRDEINKKIIGYYNDIGVGNYSKHNSERISNIEYEGIFGTNSMDSNLKDIELEKVLNLKTNIEVKKNKAINKANIILKTNNLISEVITNKVNVIQEIEIQEKKVLTDNCETIEVAKPINTVDIDVITDLNIDNQSVITKQTPLKVIEEISENKLEAIADIKPNLLEGVIGNIDKEEQIIKINTFKVASLDPINEYVDYEEIDKKPLRLDPTGEGYIGVVLEDGTFEPLKVSVKNINVLPDGTTNILANLDAHSQLSNVVRNLDSMDKQLFVESLNITSSKTAVKYQEDSIKKLDDMISFSTNKISSITNKEDTAYVVAKDKMDSINTIASMKEVSINQFKGVNIKPVVETVELITEQVEVIEEVTLLKETTDVLKN